MSLYQKPHSTTNFFKNISQFDQATAFQQKKDFTKHVHHLSFDSMEYGTQFIMDLPLVFPHVKTILWKSGTVSSRQNAASLALDDTQQLFHGMAENWDHVEYIVDLSHHLYLPIRLLESTTCNQLASIDISFRVYNEAEDFDTQVHYKLKTLIATIHNAPSLESVTVRSTPIRLGDMEDLPFM